MDSRDRKIIFEGKEKYAARKMLSNREIKTLTQNEHEILDKLCEMRHQLHISSGSMWNSESSESDTIKRYFRDLLIEIDGMELVINIDDIETDIDFYFEVEEEEIDSDSEEYEELRRDSLERHLEQINYLNTQIEEFLKKIDDVHGTQYRPTGGSRKI
jgi:hypothetical protein